jgi:hypothetical protein
LILVVVKSSENDAATIIATIASIDFIVIGARNQVYSGY